MSGSKAPQRSRTSHAQRRRRLALGSCLVALLLVAGAFTVAYRDIRQNAALAPVVREPDTLAIQRPGHTEIVMQRQQEAWRITGPCSLPVNEQRLSPLFEALNQPGTRYDISDVDTDAAGLDAPLATLLVDGTRIDIGALDVTQQRRYLREGDSVELAPEWILSLVDGGLTAFASSELFPGPVARVLIDGTPSDISWTSLAATQTVAWPLPDALPDDHSMLAAEVVLDDERTLQVQIISTDAWDAVVANGEGCARLLPPQSVPVSVPGR